AVLVVAGAGDGLVVGLVAGLGAVGAVVGGEHVDAVLHLGEVGGDRRVEVEGLVGRGAHGAEDVVVEAAGAAGDVGEDLLGAGEDLREDGLHGGDGAAHGAGGVGDEGDVAALDSEEEGEGLLDLGALADLDVDAVDHGAGVEGVGAGEELGAVGEAVSVGVEVVGGGGVDVDLVVVGEPVAVGGAVGVVAARAGAG